MNDNDDNPLWLLLLSFLVAGVTIWFVLKSPPNDNYPSIAPSDYHEQRK